MKLTEHGQQQICNDKTRKSDQKKKQKKKKQ